MSRRSLNMAAVAGALVLAYGCRGGDDKARRAASPGARESSQSSETAEKRDPRAEYSLYRSLLQTSSRAERRVGGIFIDMGTRDQHKYTRGAWESGWGQLVDRDAVTFSSLVGDKGLLWMYRLREAAELVVRARATSGPQSIAVSLGGESQGELELDEDWQVVRLPLADAGPGHGQLVLERRGEGVVDFDWIWLAADSGRDPPVAAVRAAPLNIGKRVRRALLSPSTGSYGYYLLVPEGARFIFDYGARRSAEFAVRLRQVSGQTVELFREQAAEEWRTANVDLSRFAGEAVLLELATTGADSGAAWGEPGLYVSKSSVTPLKVRGKAAKNLVMVVMDTTRADAFPAFDSDSDVHVPVFDGLAAESTRFTSAYNNSNWTKPSVATLFTGLYPMTHEATKPTSVVPDDAPFLAEHLRKQGFTTALLSANPVVGERFGFKRGWDRFSVYDVEGANGHDLYRAAAEYIEERGEERFFLYVQSIDPHVTYSVPNQYSSRYHPQRYRGDLGTEFTREDQERVNGGAHKPTEKDIAWVRALYKGEVTYQDEKLGFLIDALRAKGLLDNTLVVITNDHGEEVFDHGSVGHGWSLYEELIRAPLIMHYPPLLPSGEDVHEIVEHVDLAPTVVEALGLPPMAGVEGRSFLPLVAGEPQRTSAYAVSTSDNGKRAAVCGPWKLIVRKNGDWKGLYDLSSEIAEGENLADEAELAGRLCEIRLAEALANPHKLVRSTGKMSTRRLRTGQIELDKDTRSQLEALGYL